jgi:hypothetical protein
MKERLHDSGPSASPRDAYPLQRAAFHNDLKEIDELILAGIDVSGQDHHGNTALHIATMLGHKDAVDLLLAHNASVKVKNKDGWNSLVEAISYGDRNIITKMLRKLKTETRAIQLQRKPRVLQMLNELDDFCLELKWDFHTWIPLLSNILPSDTCKLYKCGSCLRLDTTLVDFSDRSWVRGDISFLYNPAGETELTVLDNKSHVFQRIRQEDNSRDLDEEVDSLMSSDVICAQMSTKSISFVRAMAGWVFKQEKTEEIGGFASECYCVEGLTLVSKKRREHLTHEDIKKNKTFYKSISTGKAPVMDQEIWNLQHRKSLPPPPKSDVTWEEYACSKAGAAPCLGRKQIAKSSARNFKAIVAMSAEFPVSVDVLVDILEILAPVKHLSKLRQLCESRLPPGFPVKLEVPLLPTISAHVTFQNFEWRDDLREYSFNVPTNYVEDANRFANL